MSLFWGNSLPITPGVSVYNVTPPNPPPPPPTTLPDHPRVWMNPSRLTFLQNQKVANTTRWQNVLKVADAQVAKGTTTSQSDIHQLACLGGAFLGTGLQKYADRASVILVANCNASLQTYAQSDSAYNYRWAMPDISLGLDWNYAGLTPAVRQQAATWLMNAADWVWPETNSARVGAWAVTDPGSNYYWGFMGTGIAAIAAAGDDTITTGTISSPDRATYHRNLTATKWNSVAVPFFNALGKGGAWREGTGYDSSWYVSRFLDAYGSASVALSASTFPSDSLYWRLSETTPNYGFKVPIGDQARVSDASFFLYDRVSALHMTKVVNDPVLTPLMYYWFNKIGNVPVNDSTNTNSLIEELICFDPSVTPAPDLSSVSLTWRASGPGYFVSRNSWTDPLTTYWEFESGPQTSHLSFNGNGFRIWKNGWLSCDANIYSASGIIQSSNFFNNMTVGGLSQVRYDGRNTGVYSANPQIASNLIAVRAHAELVYGYPAGTGYGRVLTNDLRQVVYLPLKDVFIIVDDVTAIDATKVKIIRFQSKPLPVLNTTSTFTITNPLGTHHAYGSVFVAIGASLSTESYALGNTAGVNTSNSIAVTLPAGLARQILVTILQLSNAASPPFSVNATSDGTNITATVDVNTVTIPLNGTSTITIV